MHAIRYFQVKTPINLCDDNDKFAYLGPGYTLFFVFLKYAIAFLAVFFLFAGVYELVANAQGSRCSGDENCPKVFALLLSLYNKSNDPSVMGTQQWLNLVLVVILVFMLQLMRRKKRATAAECDEKDTSATDYTIMVENISRTVSPIDELRDLFESLEPFGESSNPIYFKICKINLTYDLTELSR